VAKGKSSKPYLVPCEPFVAWLESNGFVRCAGVKVKGGKVWRRARRVACCPWTADPTQVLFVVPNKGPIDVAGSAFQYGFRAIAEELGVEARELFFSIWPEVQR